MEGVAIEYGVYSKFASLSAAIGLIPAAIAHQKGRSFATWWVYGALLFIFALPHSIVLNADQRELERRKLAEGMKKRPYCAELVREDASVCRYCGPEPPETSPDSSPAEASASDELHYPNCDEVYDSATFRPGITPKCPSCRIELEPATRTPS